MTNPRKLVDLQQLRAIIADLRAAGLRVVFTNGCFDIIHPGHILHLQQARQEGDVLVVALNSDESVRQLKGPDRPVFSQQERATVLAALEPVDYVTIFDTPHVTEILVTEEREALERCGTEIRLLPQIGNFSTTDIINRVRNNSNA